MMACIEMPVLCVSIDHKICVGQCDVRSLLLYVVLNINFLTRYSFCFVINCCFDMCFYFLSSSLFTWCMHFISFRRISHTHTHICLCVNISRNPLETCRHVVNAGIPEVPGAFCLWALVVREELLPFGLYLHCSMHHRWREFVLQWYNE